MNNDLEQFSEERLKDIIELADNPTVVALARIALATKQAKPVAYADAQAFKNFQQGIASKEWMWAKEDAGLQPIYTTPQPAHTERDGWIECSERMPEIGDVVITAYQGATNIGEMERSGRGYRYFTSIASGRELPADFWMPLTAAPKPESE